MRVFVTGGNGFIGSAVVRALAARGDEVVCLLRDTSRTTRIDDLRYTRVRGDVRDAASVHAGMRGADAVAHLAGLSNWTDIHSPLMPDVVINGTRHILEAATAGGRPRVVFVSSSTAVNGTREPVVHDERSTCTLPLDRFIYVKAKREAEQLCREYAGRGLPVTIVNPAEVYGPDDYDGVTCGNLVDFARSSPVFVSRGGTSIVHVDDVADGIVRALDRGTPGERYILGGDNLSVAALADLTLDILGLHAPGRRRIVTIPTPLLTTVARVGGALRLPLPFNPAIVPYAVLYWFMDSTKARRDLGATFRPARAVLEPTLAWVKTHVLDAGRR